VHLEINSYHKKRTAGRAEKVTFYKEIPLFIDLDDEENRGENMNVDPTGNGVDEEPTLQSSFETRQTVGDCRSTVDEDQV
jgi:hypothetical protein